MIKTYNYDYIIENFAKTKVVTNTTEVLSEVGEAGTSKTASKATKLLQQGKDYTARKVKQGQDFANRKWNQAKENAPIQYRKTKEYVHDHKGKIAISAIAAGVVGAGTGIVVNRHVKAAESGLTFDEQLEKQNNELKRKLGNQGYDAANSVGEGASSLADSAAGFAGDVFEAACPNCTLYFIIAGVVFVGLILLFYFK